MRHAGKHVVVGGLAALVVSAALLPVGKPFIDRGLESRARASLDAAGVRGVDVRSSWARIELSGAGSERASALAAVETMADRDAVHSVAWREAGTAAVPPATMQPSASTGVVRVAVDATFEAAAGRTLTLTGTVPDPATQARLIAAATATGVTVKDAMTVSPGVTVDGADAASTRFADVLSALVAARFAGTAGLADTRITVSGAVPDAAAATAVNSALAAARAGGTAVDGDVSAPDGTPTGASTALQARLAALLTRRPVTFVTAQASLTAQGRATLDQAAAILRTAPQTRITILGYTDDRGRAEINRQLSVARARTVMSYLSAKGIAAERLTAVGRGESGPVASNATAAGRAANRRIELTVTKG